MLARLKWRVVATSLLAAAAVAACLMPARAQTPTGQPITIGFGMALTGPLAPNGRQALLGIQIWAEEINAKGGLLGRPVKLVHYDDQSNPSTIPGIYTKLLDVDKVDLVLGGYATNMVAPAMPVIIQKKKTFISLFSLDVNAEFSNNACEGARANAKTFGFKIVYDKTYPPSTTDFTPIVRALQAANADLVVVCSYPLSSVGMVLTHRIVRYLRTEFFWW